ncbi:MAG: hypothetical protein RMX63_16800 [Aulosira sp. ZfuCHP01]|nr:hypothetical protein [Aulosira sp. ZfuCHP01]
MTHLGTSLYRINQARNKAANKRQTTRKTIKIQEIPIMSNELFTAVTVEEQELVSGGIDAAYGSAYSVLATTTKVLGPVAATNGANGSTFSFGGALDASTLAITSTVVAGIHI